MKKLSVAIVCYPTYGGSGLIATEIGMEMARRGHQVHFVSYDIPFRLRSFLPNIFYHEVQRPQYPVFVNIPYTLPLASTLSELIEDQQLDVIHCHYAIPHAVSAYLACKVLKGRRQPKIITTLHGTDITLVGSERGFLPLTRFAIEESDSVTAVSKYLRDETYKRLRIKRSKKISVIPNFVDTDEFKPCTQGVIRKKLCTKTSAPVLCHVSNFRPVKRIDITIRVFAEVIKKVQSHLLLVGDGPERDSAAALVNKLRLAKHVTFLGKQDSLPEILSSADVFLLTSESEGFGVAALEAMSCGVPVVSTMSGGPQEFIRHGKNGFLHSKEDIRGMAASAINLLKDKKLYARISEAGRKTVENKYSIGKIVNEYEKLYYGG